MALKLMLSYKFKYQKTHLADTERLLFCLTTEMKNKQSCLTWGEKPPLHYKRITLSNVFFPVLFDNQV